MPTPTKRTARSTKRVATKAANEPTLSSPSVQIFQIHYKGDQKEHLDPAFTEFDNKKGEAETHEFAVFEALTKTKQAKEADY